jgi:hypothetical protein
MAFHDFCKPFHIRATLFDELEQSGFCLLCRIFGLKARSRKAQGFSPV